LGESTLYGFFANASGGKKDFTAKWRRFEAGVGLSRLFIQRAVLYREPGFAFESGLPFLAAVLIGVVGKNYQILKNQNNNHNIVL